MSPDDYYDKYYSNEYSIRDIIELSEPLDLWAFIIEYAEYYHKLKEKQK